MIKPYQVLLVRCLITPARLCRSLRVCSSYPVLCFTLLYDSMAPVIHKSQLLKISLRMMQAFIIRPPRDARFLSAIFVYPARA
jgi:hypothetical protein